jgi:ribonuclease HI
MKAFQNLGFWFRHHLYTLILKAFPAFLEVYYYFFSLNWGNIFMEELILLTDGSVNTQSNIGYGAYLSLAERGLSLDLLRTRVKVRRFEHTSSTKLELQTLLWALSDIQALGVKVIVYTDSQNIMGLQGRRDRFEQNGYRSKKNKRLNHYNLYQEFYRMIDQLDCEFIKVRGHQVSNQKDDMDRLFTLVDRASRNALRKDNH